MTADNQRIYDRDGHGARTLDVLESAVRYNAWVAARVRPWLGNRNLEIGAGMGTITASILASMPGAASEGEAAFELVEPVEGLRQELAERFASTPAVTIGARDFFAATAEYDCIYSTNVLEHVPDYLPFVEHAAGLLVPGGHFVALVPAHPWLMSDFDRAIGHYRRFGRAEAAAVRALITERSLPLEVVRWRYFNPVGALGWLLKMRLLGQDEVRLRDVRLNERLMPIHRLIDRIDLGFGQSLCFVIRRTD